METTTASPDDNDNNVQQEHAERYVLLDQTASESAAARNEYAWHLCEDSAGPKYTYAQMARACGISATRIRQQAWAHIRFTTQDEGEQLTPDDCFCLARLHPTTRQAATAIASALDKSVENVTKAVPPAAMPGIVAKATSIADEQGTDVRTEIRGQVDQHREAAQGDRLTQLHRSGERIIFEIRDLARLSDADRAVGILDQLIDAAGYAKRAVEAQP